MCTDLCTLEAGSAQSKPPATSARESSERSLSTPQATSLRSTVVSVAVPVARPLVRSFGSPTAHSPTSRCRSAAAASLAASLSSLHCPGSATSPAASTSTEEDVPVAVASAARPPDWARFFWLRHASVAQMSTRNSTMNTVDKLTGGPRSHGGDNGADNGAGEGGNPCAEESGRQSADACVAPWPQSTNDSS